MTATLLHRYEPFGAAARLFADRSPEVVLSGPAGTGKSFACLQKMHMCALANPGMRGLIARKTLVSLGSTGMVTWRKHVIPEAAKTGVVRFYGGSQQEAAAYRYENGSTMVVGGLDRPTRIMSSEYDLIFVQEATELDVEDWESLTTRLRNGVMSFQQLMADCNPSTPTHWLKLRAEAGRTRMLESRHEDNPRLFGRDGNVTPDGAAYLAKLDALTGPRYQRLRRGLWVSAEGVIYDGYDTAVHLVDRFDIPAGWPRYWAVDFGFTNPFVLQQWAVDPDGRFWLYREIYRTQRLVEDHAADIIEACTDPDPDYVHPAGQPRYPHHGRIWREPKPVAIICDHDAEGRATLERHLGMSTTPAKKAVTEGIQLAQARMKVAGDGRPRLFLVRDAVMHRDKALMEAGKPTSTAEEMLGYVWAVKRTKDGEMVKDEPVKQDDHGMDAMRYFVVDRDLRGEPQVRWI
jgi:phage terminase large subunit